MERRALYRSGCSRPRGVGAVSRSHGMHVAGRPGSWTVYDNAISSRSVLSYAFRTKKEAEAYKRRLANGR